MARAYQVYGGGFASGYFRDPKRNTNISIRDESIPVINSMIAHTVDDAVSAATKTCSQLMKDMKRGIKSGSVESIRIPKRKILNVRGMVAGKKGGGGGLLNRFKTRKIKNGSQILAYMLRVTRRFMGKAGGGASLMQAVNYQRIAKQGAVVGWGSKTSPYWGSAVQEGKRGAPGSLAFRGSQPIVKGSKQWKFLAAIGMLPKGGRALEQPKALFFEPFIRVRLWSGWVNKFMNDYLVLKLKDREAKALLRKTA